MLKMPVQWRALWSCYRKMCDLPVRIIHILPKSIEFQLKTYQTKKNLWTIFLKNNFWCFSIYFNFHRGNTEGWRCEQCKSGYFGNPAKGCELCRCQSEGSENNECDRESGQCKCKKNYDGYQCNECAVWYFAINLLHLLEIFTLWSLKKISSRFYKYYYL